MVFGQPMQIAEDQSALTLDTHDAGLPLAAEAARLVGLEDQGLQIQQHQLRN